MNFFRNYSTVGKDKFETAVAYYSEVRKGLREKANHNKQESQIGFFSIICFTLTAPLFVTMGEGWFWGKLLPAILSVLAGGATAWLQLRKPQRLWAIYRRAQRELEREKAAYDFGLNPYGEATGRDKMLAAKVSEIAFRVHEQWEGLVPEPDTLTVKTPSISHSNPEPIPFKKVERKDAS
jgi:hypothetical protein